MMKNKQDLREFVAEAIALYKKGEKKQFWKLFEDKYWGRRIKFPYHEFIGAELYNHLGAKDALRITDKMIELAHEGGYVIAGMVLQKHMIKDFEISCQKAVSYIIKGDVWFACDIISDRVFGYGLVHEFAKTFKVLESFVEYPNYWIQRVIGIATHVAAKRIIDQKEISLLFELAMRQVYDKNINVKKGCGWGIETIAKFYPEFAIENRHRIEEDPKVNSWHKKKIKMGLKKGEIYRAKLAKKS